MESHQESYSKVLLTILGLLTLWLCFVQPAGGLPPAHGGVESAAKSGDETGDHEPAIKIAIGKKAKAEAGQAQYQPSTTGNFKMPYIEGTPRDPQEYLQHILQRGGRLLLTRGAKFSPVGQVLMDEGGIRVDNISPDSLPASLVARDVSEHARQMFENGLPKGATKLLLLWPESMQDNLVRQLHALSYLDSRLKAVYAVAGEKLHINLIALDRGGGWHAIDHTIAL